MGTYIIETVRALFLGGLSLMSCILYHHVQWFRVHSGYYRSTPAVPVFFETRLLNYKIVHMYWYSFKLYILIIMKYMAGEIVCWKPCATQDAAGNPAKTFYFNIRVEEVDVLDAIFGTEETLQRDSFERRWLW